MEIIRFALIIIYTFFTGYCVLNLILISLKCKIDLFSFIGLCGIIGFGISAIELFVYSLLHIHWHQTLLVIPWMAVFLYLLLKQKTMFQIQTVKIKDIWVILFILLLALTLVGWAITNPVFEWDGWAIWNFKAQVFYARGFIPLDFVKNPEAVFSHLEYPLLLPLAQTWVYLFLAKVQTGFSQVIYVVYYFSMLLITFSFLKKVIKNYHFPLVFTFLLAMTPSLVIASQINYADILIGVFFLSGITYLIKWVRYHQKIDIWLMSILLGLGAFTKQEGSMIYGLVILFILIGVVLEEKRGCFRRLKSTAVPIVVGLMPWLVWEGYTKVNALQLAIPTSNINLDFLLANTARFKVIFSAIYHLIIGSPSLSSGYVWLLFVFVGILAFCFKSETRRYYILLLAILLSYAMIYYIVPSNTLEWYLETSLDRLMLQVIPAAILLSAYTLLELWKLSTGKGVHERV
jgi:hypothetical protein